ncbi:hypothetical protein BDY21DRAFT_339668 [Lineolata rhizophorae]|uniref:Nucleoporin complex subunit 54-domain-containing protein n=1 Tax=Lineolata rhizophorae TaxID=578093 RepID=A0A6A6P4Y6_9PEZI|nr:hypothetical protein BDY21DRAFT_339668 [Lineolata rhizophorae]
MSAFSGGGAGGGGGGVFGGAPSQSGSGGGLLGAAPSSQPGATGGGLFGGASSQSAAGGGLFGGSTGSQNQQQNTGMTSGFGGPSLFGGNAQQTPGQQSSGGIFGNLSQSKPSTAPSLFAPSSQQQQPSLFGATSNIPPSSRPMFAGPLPGAITPGQNQPLQQPVPGVNIDVSQMRSTTRFNDLHSHLQEQIMQIDSLITAQTQAAAQVSAFLPSHGEALKFLPNDADYLTQRVDAVELALDNDSTAIAHQKSTLTSAARDASRVFRAAENLKLPPQFHYHIAGSIASGSPTAGNSAAPRVNAPALEGDDDDDDPLAPVDLIPFFSTCADELRERLRVYESQLSEVGAHMSAIEARVLAETEAALLRAGAQATGADGVEGSKDEQIRVLYAVLRDFEAAILKVAGHVGVAREGVLEVTGMLGGPPPASRLGSGN